MADKLVAMNISIARMYAGIIAECAASTARSSSVRQTAEESAKLLSELAQALKRLAGKSEVYNRGWDQVCKYLKVVDSRQVPATEAMAGRATLCTSPEFGAKGFTLCRGDDRSSGADELRALNSQTREILTELATQYPRSFWSTLFGRAKSSAPGVTPKKAASTIDRPATCAACGKAVRPFEHPKGAFVGTLSELSELKVEPDHALVCGSCNAVVCPVCLGKEATKRGARKFVCPKCGHTPVDTIYRA